MMNHTSIHEASSQNDTKAIEALLSEGVGIECPEQTGGKYFGKTPLMIAALEGNLAAINTLLDKGANTETKDSHDRTALMLSAMENKPGAIKALLKRGADIEARDYMGETAISLAAAYCSHDAISILLAYGAKINTRDDQQNNPLHRAAWSGSCSGKLLALELLLARKADRSVVNINGLKPCRNINERSEYALVVRSMINNHGESLKSCARTCIRARLIENGIDVSSGQSSGINSLPLPVPLKMYIYNPVNFE